MSAARPDGAMARVAEQLGAALARLGWRRAAPAAEGLTRRARRSPRPLARPGAWQAVPPPA